MATRYLMYIMIIGCVAGILYGYRLHDEAGKMLVDEEASLVHAEERLGKAEVIKEQGRGLAEAMGTDNPAMAAASQDADRAAQETYDNAKSRYDRELAEYEVKSVPKKRKILLGTVSYGVGIAMGIVGIILLARILVTRK